MVPMQGVHMNEDDVVEDGPVVKGTDCDGELVVKKDAGGYKVIVAVDVVGSAPVELKVADSENVGCVPAFEVVLEPDIIVSTVEVNVIYKVEVQSSVDDVPGGDEEGSSLVVDGVTDSLEAGMEDREELVVSVHVVDGEIVPELIR
ncbi:hypothetical protein LTS18_004838 [Coniosporium uncinatum]|uniref:Uncharacterized protein n=1 Tax=Coniosporium uncinatum TaxID=93489 RepID=A0ACC3DRW8_9PEZI|nr:hypothetical protein LTS18_004838 [Coniosporium uncinatum]